MFEVKLCKQVFNLLSIIIFSLYFIQTLEAFQKFPGQRVTVFISNLSFQTISTVL